MQSFDSDSSCPSVDTDADSGADATPDALLKRIIATHIGKGDSKATREHDEALVDSGSDAEAAGSASDAAAKAPGSAASAPVAMRHAPGTWKSGREFLRF